MIGPLARSARRRRAARWTARAPLAALLLVLAACPKPPAPPAIDYQQPPQLPAPESATYGQEPATPKDAVVASVVKGKRWDAYLSGGGTDLALALARTAQAPSPWTVRESLWRAGWPYPIDKVVTFQAPSAAPPPDAIRTWVDGVPADAALGLVRARGAKVDAWVGLVSHPRVDLGRLPRALGPGDVLALPPLPGARYRIADADGRLLEGPLDLGLHLQVHRQGEWVVQVLDGQGVAAWFPVYVGVAPPADDLLPAKPVPVHDPQDVLALTTHYLGAVRDAYGAARWTHDPILDAAASRLEQERQDTLAAVLSDLGIADPMATWTCTAPSTEACVDAWAWDPTRRATLLSTKLTHMGLAATMEGAKVRIRVVLTGG